MTCFYLCDLLMTNIMWLVYFYKVSELTQLHDLDTSSYYCGAKKKKKKKEYKCLIIAIILHVVCLLACAFKSIYYMYMYMYYSSK